MNITITLVILCMIGICHCQVDRNRPILVGILTQPVSISLKESLPRENVATSYIASSYVKYFSQTGAIPIMIPWDAELKKFKEMIEGTDILFFPGGGTDLRVQQGKNWVTTPFQDRMHTAFQVAIHINKVHKKYFPVIATCLGMEALGISFAGNDPNVLNSGFDDNDTKHKVKIWEENFKKSLYFDLSNRDLYREYLESGELYFHHDDGFLIKTITEHQILNKEFIITTSSLTDQGLDFVSSMEHRNLPIYANLFHPEKTQYERSQMYNFLSRDAKWTDLISRNLMMFIQRVRDKTRTNARTFTDIPTKLLTYSSLRRIPEYIKENYSYEQVYLFAKHSNLSDKMYELMISEKAKKDLEKEQSESKINSGK